MNTYQLAPGHDNVAGLKPLDQLDPPLFDAYQGGWSVEFHPSESTRWAEDRTPVPVGRPWAAWRFFWLTPRELEYMRRLMGKSVTIRTLDVGENKFKNFNGTLVLPVQEAWVNLRVEIRDLEEVKS